MDKKFPVTYDMTFCISKCKKKCYRHISQYKFKRGYLYGISNFDCEHKGILKKYEKYFNKENNNG